MSRDDLLDRVLSLLSAHSWLYTFKWTELLSCPNFNPIEACPKDWSDALCNGRITDLQQFIISGQTPSSWPESLKAFASQCLTLTQELIRSATNTPPIIDSSASQSASNGVLSLNKSAGYLFYNIEPAKAAPRKVKQKKHHETEIMSAFLCDLLQNSAIIACNPCDSDKMSTFQTAPFECPMDSQNMQLYRIELSLLPMAFVDLGSGLGHLPRRVMQRLGTNCSNIRCIAVEADPKLHSTALNMESKEQEPKKRLIRVLSRIEKSNIDQFKGQLSEVLNADDLDGGYILCGLHCCGDLSEAALKLFHVDSNAQGIVLVGCCYHKMSLRDSGCQNFSFPLSLKLRSALQRCPPSAEKSLKMTVALRLACQWSPQQWSHWTPSEIYEHRVRVFIRSLLEVHLNPRSAPLENISSLKRLTRLPPVITLPSQSNLNSIKQPLPELNDHWRSLEAIAKSGSTARVDVEELIWLTKGGDKVWDLLPGLTALQQLIQPLLEALILADRLWSLESCSEVGYASLVRLFDPFQSPRCMALVAVKKTV
ncbi:unnamed protein product [Rodentolepis nana]|uniref:Methyltranfer_dom domain-containing protein n=1 Tax=Rodentolepis nana TaxID=102285 RepID=A0A0R3T7U5_RODNA|nr:unnamed protein product [Rodentolepis nana]